MRLVICDGNRIFSEALAAALEAHDHGVTALATSTPDDCIAAVASYPAQLCMLDLYLPKAQDGLEVIRQIRNRSPDTAVVVISEISDADIWVRVRTLGIAGFLNKNRNVSEVADALHRIARGQPTFDSVPSPAASPPTTPFVLTPREAEVLRRIAAGQHTRQMAREMDIAVSTLRTYVKNVFAKLGVHSRLEAAAVATRANLLGEIPSPRLSRQDEQSILPSV
jgi:DNA-binding NarL/FixJ family response regulator